MLADTAAAEADHPQHLATEFLRPSPRPIWRFRPLRDRQKCPSLALPRLPTICRGRADWAEAPATAPAPVVWQCKVTDPGRISVNEASVRRWLCRGLHSGVLHPEPDQRPSWTTRPLLRRKEVCLRHPILHTGKIPVDICKDSLNISSFFRQGSRGTIARSREQRQIRARILGERRRWICAFQLDFGCHAAADADHRPACQCYGGCSGRPTTTSTSSVSHFVEATRGIVGIFVSR